MDFKNSTKTTYQCLKNENLTRDEIAKLWGSKCSSCPVNDSIKTYIVVSMTTHPKPQQQPLQPKPLHCHIMKLIKLSITTVIVKGADQGRQQKCIHIVICFLKWSFCWIWGLKTWPQPLSTTHWSLRGIQSKMDWLAASLWRQHSRYCSSIINMFKIPEDRSHVTEPWWW